MKIQIHDVLYLIDLSAISINEWTQRELPKDGHFKVRFGGESKYTLLYAIHPFISDNKQSQNGFVKMKH